MRPIREFVNELGPVVLYRTIRKTLESRYGGNSE